MCHTMSDDKKHVDAAHIEQVDVLKESLGQDLDYSGAVSKSDPKEIALVRKLDFRIMPTLWAMYFLNYLDRNTIAQARLDNLESDLGLEGNQYNTCISILFVGYLLMQIPSNMIMSTGKVPPSTYMGVCMMVWAVVSACTALVHDYKGLVLVRFFLGIAEAPYYPGALFKLSLFYTRKELATRLAILYSGNIIATSVSGLIAVATFNTLSDVHGISGWRWLFIIEGSVTFGVAIISIFLLPNHPLKTTWLTPEERELAHQRIVRDTVGMEENKGVRAGFMQAIRDPRLYLFCLMQNLHLSACGFNNFFHAVGFIISCITLNTGARYFSCFLFASGAYAVNSVILGWVSATLGQTREKKAISLSIVNVLANASYIYTPYLYPKTDGPRYLTAMSANTAFAVGTIACAWGLRIWLVRTNKKNRGDGITSALAYAY
ncbi:MFS general substrate transporter [Aureobasidium pullulans]|uniref:MFS general substrate transporter n=1 Tax=Aureobasidium pullulans TaxID=5580 RepID=A0A4S9BH11_AURPU|nr:MFS general substrate transporter [Aureobasidium pullulans]